MGGEGCPRSDNDPSPEAPAPPPPPPTRRREAAARTASPGSGAATAACGRAETSQAEPAAWQGRGPQPAAPGPRGGGGFPRGAAGFAGRCNKAAGPGERQAAPPGTHRGAAGVSVGAAVPYPARRAGEGAAGGLSSPASSPLSAAFHWHGSPRGRGQLGEGVAAAGRSGPGWESSSPAAAQAGSGGRRRCSVRALGSFRPHQGRAGPRGPRKAGRRERGRSPRRLVAILVLLLRGAECPLPARLPGLPPPPSAPPPLPGWLRWPPLPRPGEAG